MRNIASYIALLAVLLGLGTLQAQGTVTDTDNVARARAAEYYFMESVALMQKDSVAQAMEMLEHCHALDPESSAIMYELASFYMYLNRDSAAHELLNRMVKSDPTNKYYNQVLVNYYYKTGDKESAIKVYETMLDKASSKSDIYQSLYLLYTENGEYEKAIRALDEYGRIEGYNQDLEVHKLRLHVMMQDTVSALDVVGRLIEKNPGDTRYVTLLGDTYVLFGNYGKAEDAFRQVLVEAPDDIFALSSMGNLYQILNNDSMYCNTVERLLKSEKLDTKRRIETLLGYTRHKESSSDTTYIANFLKGMTELPFDRIELAEFYVQYLTYRKAPQEDVAPVLEKILQLDPEHRSSMLQLLLFAAERNDYDAVIKYADNALMYIPDMLELYYYKGISLYLTGKKEESLGIYRKGLERRSDESSYEMVSTMFTLLGDTYHELGRIDECMEAYDSALVYNPTSINVLNNYAYYLALENKDLPRALEMSRKTIEEEPENPTYIDTYAWVLFMLERYEEARAYADKLMAIEGDKGSVEYLHCGDIYAKCGLLDKAVEYWIKAQESGDDSSILKKKIKNRRYYNEKKRRK